MTGHLQAVDSPKEVEKVIKAAEVSEARLNVGRASNTLKLDPRNIVSGVYNRLEIQGNPAITAPRTGNAKVTFQKLQSGFSDLQGLEISSNSLNDFNVSLHPEEELARRG